MYVSSNTKVSDVIIGELAKRARHYQGCTNSSWCSICVYIYSMYGGTCSIIVYSERVILKLDLHVIKRTVSL